MGEKRQKNQWQLALPFGEGSEAPRVEGKGPKRPGRGEKPRTRLETSD